MSDTVHHMLCSKPDICSQACPCKCHKPYPEVASEEPRTVLTFEHFDHMNEKRHREWPREDGGSEKWNLSDWGVAVAEEAGEVCGAIKRFNRITNKQIMKGGTQRVHTLEEARQQIQVEIGDVTTYLSLLAQELGTTLEECCRKAYNGVSEREGLPHRI